jgi:hypothetical protein
MMALAAKTFAAVDVSKLPPASAKTGVTYDKDIKPLFQQTCFRCHGSERQKADLRLDSLDAVLKGSENGKVVIAGKSTESPLVIAVSQLDPKKAMPPKPRGPGGPGGNRNRPASADATNASGPTTNPGVPGGPGGRGGGMAPKPLTLEQVGLVRAWIDQGAK